MPEVINPEVETPCRHHWMLGSPVGELSKGVCKLCGALREFQSESRFLYVPRKAPSPAEETTS
jgi:hypothetical protein